MREGKGNGKGGGEGIGGGEEGMASIKRGREKRRSVHQARYTTNQTPLFSATSPSLQPCLPCVARPAKHDSRADEP